MNYAEKELREVMAYLDEARANQEAIKGIQRALELGQPVQVSFRSASHSTAALCPNKSSKALLVKLEQQAWERIMNLEKQEVYWCQEVAAVAQREALHTDLMLNPEKSVNDFRAEAKEQDEEGEASRPTPPSQSGKGHVGGPPVGFGPQAEQERSQPNDAMPSSPSIV